MTVPFLLFFVCFFLCDGFLLDSSTTIASGGTFEDKRYNMLMELLTEERRSRLKMEEAVSQELLALKQEVARCSCLNGNNQLTMSNTSNLLSNETISLKSELLELKSNYESIKGDYQTTKEKIQQLELEMSSLKQYKIAVDIQNITRYLENEIHATNNEVNSIKNEAEARKQDLIALYQQIQATKHFEEEIQTANNEINSIKSDAEARKQDFIALFQRVQNSEQNLENRITFLAVSQNLTFFEVHKEILTNAEATEQNCTRQFNLLNESQNVISSKLQQQTVKLDQELNKIKNRAAITSCYTDTANTVFRFKGIETAMGITDLDSIRNAGTFKCEKPGLYLISVFIMTSTNNAVFSVQKNTETIADGYSSQTNFYQTTSVTVVRQLVIGDVISVTGSFYVYGGYHSCLSLIQIQ